ncbi:MAG TPA: EAL domain-containing protein [Steroidobacteraceae bacterium]|jgi:diguanylate cyclase (GGDEF)-like protein|nr:EAL domain-containing protein [Steroidobacteraceae bacterium]
MNQHPIEPRNGPRISVTAVRTIIISYLLDAALLGGFATTGRLRWPLVLSYLALGLGDSALFYYQSRRPLPTSLSFQQRMFARLIAGTAILLVCAALAPQLAFYFLGMLFVLQGFGSITVPMLQSAIAWSIVAAATAWLALHGDAYTWDPAPSATERTLIWLACISILGRFVMLGIVNRRLRERLQQRSAELRESIDALRRRDQSLEQVNAELQHQATHDALTGLANRLLFTTRLEQACRDARPFALCVLDLDRFKIINDSMGHSVGDALLKLVGERLRAATRAQDTIARAGGDEFLLLLREVEARADTDKLVQRWMQALAEPYLIQGAEIHVSPSMGIARYPTNASDGEELLARADEAMYQAKQSGRNAYRFFDAEVMGRSRERLSIEGDLRQALTQSQLQLHYQPKIDIATGRIHSVEALLRWQHPVRGMVRPDEFIPIAEDTGLILPIGDWVVREACRQAQRWQAEQLPFGRIAVNVSPLQFRQPDFPNTVRTALHACSLDSHCLGIELTEATLMSNAERSIAMLEQLSRFGVAVAVDDFGTGYSNMTYLQRFPIDELKIDRSFILELEEDADSVSIVRAIVSLGHGLRLRVVAEGVETASQLERLRRMGCDEYQGFLCSPALPPDQLGALLRARIEPVKRDADRTYSKITRLVRRRS